MALRCRECPFFVCLWFVFRCKRSAGKWHLLFVSFVWFLFAEDKWKPFTPRKWTCYAWWEDKGEVRGWFHYDHVWLSSRTIWGLGYKLCNETAAISMPQLTISESDLGIAYAFLCSIAALYSHNFLICGVLWPNQEGMLSRCPLFPLVTFISAGRLEWVHYHSHQLFNSFCRLCITMWASMTRHSLKIISAWLTFL